MVRTTLQGVASTIGSLGKPSQQQSALPSPPKTEPETTVAESDTKESSPVASDSTATDSDLTALDSNTTASDSDAAAPVTNTVAAVTDPVAPVSDPVPPVSPVTKVVEPVTNFVVTLGNVVQSIPATLAALPTSATPVTDVITTVQVMLTAVVNAAIPLIQVPSDLYSLLGVAWATPTVIGASAGHGAGLLTAGGAAVLGPPMPPPPLILPTSGIWGVPSLGQVAPPPALGSIATMSLSQELSLSGMASPAPEAVSPPDALSILGHAVSALVIPASLSALAAIALPGVGGLLIVCAAGVRLGYRQAKAGLALRATGIARFAGSGPLGVVRSGSLVALRPRAARGVRPEVSRAPHLLEQAA
jgi:hypothetical protein